ERATAFWVAGAVNDPQLIPDLQAGLFHSVPGGWMGGALGVGKPGGGPGPGGPARTARGGEGGGETFSPPGVPGGGRWGGPAAEQSNRRPEPPPLQQPRTFAPPERPN